MSRSDAVANELKQAGVAGETDLAARGTARPIFIIGAPRSATSAMTWALGQHPNIQVMPETAWIASLATGGYLSWVKGSERGRFSHLSNADYPLDPFMVRIGEAVDSIVRDVFAVRCGQYYGDYRALGKLSYDRRKVAANLQLLRSIDDPKQRWIDGTPLNTQYLWIISRMFPEARFLHNLRRPDEVATSLEGFTRVGADAQPLEVGLQTWMQHTENAWLAERAFGCGKVFRVDFSRVAEDPESLMRDVLAFLGEDYSSDCLLPLGKRLNSSEVDDKRESNLVLLREMEACRTAEALYAQVQSSSVPEVTDAEAEGILRQRFLDYCHERSLV